MENYGNSIDYKDDGFLMVEIPKMEYRTLIEESITLDTLLRGILNNAKLGWDKTDLTYNDKDINAIIAAMFPESYKAKLLQVQVKQEQEEQS